MPLRLYRAFMLFLLSRWPEKGVSLHRKSADQGLYLVIHSQINWEYIPMSLQCQGSDDEFLGILSLNVLQY